MHAATIEIRRPQYDFAALPRHYIDHNPLLSALFSALSLTFPEGERLFVHSVRLVRDQVKDPQLQQQIAGFIGQEALKTSSTLISLMLAMESFGIALPSPKRTLYARGWA